MNQLLSSLSPCLTHRFERSIEGTDRLAGTARWHRRHQGLTRPHFWTTVEQLTYLLTPWGRVLFEKLTGLQLVKKFPAFYGTRRFLNAFTSTCQLSLSWSSSIQPRPTYLASLRSILILSSHLRSSLSSGLLPSRFPTRSLYTPLPHMLYMPHPSHSSRLNHPNNIWWVVQIIKLLIMQFSPLPCYLVTLRPKYSPQHHILKHPQTTFLPHSHRPRFKPIQNNRQNYCSIYLNL